jgi:N-acylneuraminate cytidylyltransferase
MSNIAIIPARGGSKRIPRKNIKAFFGKPIIAYSIEAAIKSDVFDEVMVSTDDDEIAEIAKKYGAVVPFLRSVKTSTDMAGTAPVLLEVLSEYERLGKSFANVCCLYPCAPFVTPERLKQGMDLLFNSNADSVLPIVRFSYPPQRCLVIREGRTVMINPENYNVRSQDLEPLYHDTGQFYCLKSSALKEEKTLFCKQTLSVVLSENEVQDIDTEDDWKAAEIKYEILNIKRG